MKEKQNLLKKLLTGLLITAITLCMTACSDISINFDALKDMLSPPKEKVDNQDEDKTENQSNKVEDKEEIPEEEIPEESEQETPEEEIPEEPEEEPFVPTTEEEYKIACQDKLEEFALAIAKLNSRSVETIFSVDNIVYNIEKGNLYFTTNGKYYTSKQSFFYIVKDEELSKISSYENLLDKISKLANESRIKEVYVEREELLSEYASQEYVESFVKYILNELSNMQNNVNVADCKVLNISPFSFFIKGKYQTEIVAISGNKEYYLKLRVVSDTNNDDECIKRILNGADTEIIIKMEADFKSFDEIGSVTLD